MSVKIKEKDLSAGFNSTIRNEMLVFRSLINLNYVITPASIIVSLIYPTRV